MAPVDAFLAGVIVQMRKLLLGRQTEFFVLGGQGV